MNKTQVEEEKKNDQMYRKIEKNSASAQEEEEVIDHNILNQIYPEVKYIDVA